jgi:hypothetical protein
MKIRNKKKNEIISKLKNAKQQQQYSFPSTIAGFLVQSVPMTDERGGWSAAVADNINSSDCIKYRRERKTVAD